MMKKVLAGVVLSSMFYSSVAFAAAGYDVNLDPGASLNQLKDYFDRELTAMNLEEGKKVAATQVKSEKSSVEETKTDVKAFKLKDLTIDESKVLTQDELKAIKSYYIGKDASLNDLYAILDKINEIYAKKGNFTCRAFLPPQTIKNGIVHIKLIEGTNGTTIVSGNKHTKAEYIKNRMRIVKGEIPTLDQLNKDILRFNATNDAQLRIVMNKGKEVGTTDYELVLQEPQNSVVTVFTDVAGNRNTGIWRGGVFYNIRSLSGNRDNLSLGYVGSQGTHSGSIAYSTPVNRMGTKVNVAFSANTVRSIRDLGYKTKGNAQSLSLGVSQPLITTAKTRSEVFLEYNHQKSKTEMTDPINYTLVDDKTNEFALGFAMTNYGKSHLIYQRHSLVHGNVSYGVRDQNTTAENYNLYRGAAIYQKAYQHGQQINARMELQKSFKENVPSSRSFYIGGMNTVRGYYENFLAADGGFFLSTEYQVPITKDKKTSAYVSMDYGRLFGENRMSENIDRHLWSAGFGFKSVFAQKFFANLAFAFPLKKSFDGMDETASRMRIHFLLTGQM